jgi:hypothetical protein
MREMVREGIGVDQLDGGMKGHIFVRWAVVLANVVTAKGGARR